MRCVPAVAVHGWGPGPIVADFRRRVFITLVEAALRRPVAFIPKAEGRSGTLFDSDEGHIEIVK